MVIQLISPVKNLKIDSNHDLFQIENFTVFNGADFLSEVTNYDSFVENIGLMNLNQLQNSLCMFFSGDVQELEKIPGIKDCDQAAITNKAQQFITTLFSYLWFVKDNSVLSNLMFSYTEGALTMGATNSFIYCNCFGETNITIFNESELDEWIKIIDIVHPLRKADVEVDFPKYNYREQHIAQSNYDYIPYNSHNRINRALNF